MRELKMEEQDLQELLKDPGIQLKLQNIILNRKLNELEKNNVEQKPKQQIEGAVDAG